MAPEASSVDERRCDWCGETMRDKAKNAITCSKPCRQARARFRIDAPKGATPVGAPIRVAYADPPYPGLAQKYYEGGLEVDHAELVARLMAEFPAGWALSTSAESCRAVWALCPPQTRLCPWVRGSRRGRAHRARVAWEALLVYGGRAQRLSPRDDLADVLVWGGRQHSHPGALVGMKPAAFAEWMFRLLGLGARDELVDLYPGSGAIGRAWRLYCGASRSTRATPSQLKQAQQRVAAAATTRRRPRPTDPNLPLFGSAVMDYDDGPP